MKPSRCLILVCVMALWSPSAPWTSGLAGEAWAASASRVVRPGGERVDVQLDGSAPCTVVRTGERQITVRFPDGLPGGPPPAQAFGGDGLVEALSPAPDGFVLTLRTNAFGFVQSAQPEDRRVSVHVFPDRIGARWKPEAAPAAPQASRAPAAAPAQSVPAPAVAAAPSAERRAAEAEQAESAGQTAKKPFYAVPYSMRAPAQKADARPEPDAPRPAPAGQTAAKPAAPAADDRTAGQPVRPGAKAEAAQARPAAEPVQLAGNGLGVATDAPLLAAADKRPAKTAVQPAPAPAPVESDLAAPPANSSLAGPDTPSFAPVESVMPAAGEMRMRIAAPAVTGTPPKADMPPLPLATPTLPPPSIQQAAQPAEPAPQGEQRPPGAPASQAGKTAKNGKGKPAAEPEPAAPPQTAGAAAPAQAAEPVRSGPLATPQAPTTIPTGGPADLKEKAVKAPKPEKGEKGEKDKAPATQESDLTDAQMAMMNGDFPKAVEIFKSLRDRPDRKPELQEDVLYGLADSVYQVYRDDPKTRFAAITDAYKEALNFNPKARRASTALFYLGLVNLKAGNLPEAKGYFTVLRSSFPKDPNIPAINYFYGEHFYTQGQYQNAADEFQFLVQNYPEHGLTRDSAINLALSLNQLGKYDEAFKILEYVEQRWPRFYVEYPPILRLMGDGAMRLGQWDRARGYYLTYYNLNPRAEDAGTVLARIGDAYVRTGRKSAARGVYDKVLTDFPKGDAALISKLRLAEEGIYDVPTMEQMFEVFNRPYNARPVEVYTQIVKERPDSPLAPMAQLKLAMWQLFNRKHGDAIQAAQDFVKKFPDDQMLQQAKDVGMRAFHDNVAALLAEENYAKVFELWDRYPFLRENDKDMLPETRIALAYGHWKRGSPEEAIKTAAPFLDSYQEKRSDMALDLVFSILADRQDWKEIIRFGEKIRGWKIPEDRLRQINYAMALAYENVAEWDKARPLWSRLAQDPKLGPSQRAFALFYMARASYEKGDMERTNIWGQEALSLLMQVSPDDRTRLKDTVQLLLESTVRTKRYEAALGWLAELEKYLVAGDSEWQTARFRKAEIHKAMGDVAQWRSMMSELAQKYPKSLHGRLAASALSSQKIEDAAKKYVN